MLPRNKYIFWIGGLFLLVVFVIFLFLYLNNRSSSQTVSQSKTSSAQRVFPSGVTSQINSDFKILYQDPNDTEERTLLYQTSQKEFYNGVGIYERPNFWSYQIGLFDGFEAISGTTDRLLTLRDPLKNSIISQVHVVFVPSNLFTGKNKTTGISVENMSKVKSENVATGSEDYKWLVGIETLDNSQISTLIHKGDALVVYPLVDRPNASWKVMTDEKGRWYAYTVLLRRKNGAEDINI